MFLKRIELSGFKSFADRTVIQFDAPLTGVVGPNGCGKSNITDAIRWVLGEQSAKSLRSGASMGDIIFAGSQSRKPVNTARATLVFDNSQRIFDSPFDEIEITRSISRSAGEITNYINRTPCRLKDIQDLVMDTGLGRDSLSIITQGNISSFADAKPEERRTLFEEAAGVAKYKKRKKISLTKLDGVKANLERVQDLVDSYKEQLERLEQQALKAKAWLESRERLTSIEISMLAARIEQLKASLEAVREQQTRLGAAIELTRRQMEDSDQQTQALQKEIFAADASIAASQSRLASIMQEAMQLEKQKAALDERRKMDLESGDARRRRESLLELFEEARFEYQDRRARLGALETELDTLRRQESQAQAGLSQLEGSRESIRQNISTLSSRLAGVQSRLAHPTGRNTAISAVLSSRNRLEGIHGLVRDLLQVDDTYAQAVSTALASAADQIVVSSQKEAREAIAWLKAGRIGSATFLPLSVCRPRTLQSWQIQKLEGAQGLLGSADAFVRCQPCYDALKSRLLGNILLAENLEAANRAASRINHSLKIVTLEGDVVHAGGAMSGGYSQKQSAAASLRREKESLHRQLEQEKGALQEMEAQIVTQSARLQDLSSARVQKQIDREKVASFLQIKKEKYESLQGQIAQLDLSSDRQNDSALVARLSALQKEQDELNSSLSLAAENKKALLERQQQSSAQTRQARRELSASQSELQKLELESARLETHLEQDLLRLGSDYSLTYEAARAQAVPVDLEAAQSEVKSLRRKLSAMGSVNLEAPEQLAEIQEKYDFVTGQMNELEEARRQILEAVDEMDATMIEKFSAMFEKINGALDEVFKAMFGGGKARLVLCNPDDLLNTGIDVDVQPPGKAVKNLQTFSGGEKALIAISVLFAILKARTVPLCIFDEVEAALDQANVERFARYLNSFRDQSQFIAVTHRPGTMEQCDTLYGITMQQDGVSQVLKVLLKDAREMSREG